MSVSLSVACLLLATTLADPAGSVVSEAMRIDRVDPPSWWSGAGTETVMLLLEGAALEEANVSIDREDVTVERVEPGIDGRALFVTLSIAPSAAPGPLELQVERNGKRLEASWEILSSRKDLPKPFGPDDVIYLIMPDRFANGDKANDRLPESEDMLDRRDPHAYHGGDFQGIRDHLDYLAGLGVTAVWLTPIYKQSERWTTLNDDGRTKRLADFHGYAAVDQYAVNPHFGTMQEYAALIHAAHDAGLKVIQDQALGHVGPHHRWLVRPPAKNWFHGSIDNPPSCTFNFQVIADPHATDAARAGVTNGWFFGFLPDLNTQNPLVRTYAIQQSLWWMTVTNVDGVRLDTYPLIERSFWNLWSRERRRLYPTMTAVGEAWSMDPGVLSFFQGGRQGWDGIDPGVESVFDFPFFQACREVFTGRVTFHAIPQVLARDNLYPHPELLVTFLNNHDTIRLSSEPDVTARHAELAAALMLTARGIPQITWGDEVGLPGNIDDRRDFPGGFAGDRNNAFIDEGRTPRQREMFETYRRLLALRKQVPALRRGEMINVSVTNKTYAYIRQLEGERIAIAMNLGENSAEIRLHASDLGPPVTEANRLYGEGDVHVEAGGLTVTLPAMNIGIFQLR